VAFSEIEISDVTRHNLLITQGGSHETLTLARMTKLAAVRRLTAAGPTAETLLRAIYLLVGADIRETFQPTYEERDDEHA
jgi:hypothetical protein